MPLSAPFHPRPKAKKRRLEESERHKYEDARKKKGNAAEKAEEKEDDSDGDGDNDGQGPSKPRPPFTSLPESAAALSLANHPLPPLSHLTKTLSAFSQLHKLDLSNTGLSSLSWLAKAAAAPGGGFADKLTWLNVSGNPALGEGDGTGAWNGLEVFKNLFVLNASHCSLPVLPHQLSSLRSLKALVVSHNRIEKLEFIEGMADLNTLVISHNRLRALPNTLLTLSALKKLGAAHNQLAHEDGAHGERGLPDLSSLKHLREVRLNDNPGIVSLPLHLAAWGTGMGTARGGAGPVSKPGTGLEILDLAHCGLEDLRAVDALLTERGRTSTTSNGLGSAERATHGKEGEGKASKGQKGRFARMEKGLVNLRIEGNGVVGVVGWRDKLLARHPTLRVLDNKRVEGAGGGGGGRDTLQGKRKREEEEEEEAAVGQVGDRSQGQDRRKAAVQTRKHGRLWDVVDTKEEASTSEDGDPVMDRLRSRAGPPPPGSSADDDEEDSGQEQFSPSSKVRGSRASPSKQTSAGKAGPQKKPREDQPISTATTRDGGKDQREDKKKNKRGRRGGSGKRVSEATRDDRGEPAEPEPSSSFGTRQKDADADAVDEPARAGGGAEQERRARKSKGMTEMVVDKGPVDDVSAVNAERRDRKEKKRKRRQAWDAEPLPVGIAGEEGTDTKRLAPSTTNKDKDQAVSRKKVSSKSSKGNDKSKPEETSAATPTRVDDKSDKKSKTSVVRIIDVKGPSRPETKAKLTPSSTAARKAAASAPWSPAALGTGAGDGGTADKGIGMGLGAVWD